MEDYMILNYVIGTESEWLATGISPEASARRFEIDTPHGKEEVILQHVDIHSSEFEVLVRKMPNDNFLSAESLEFILPIEGDEDGI
jgi:hypothetical protein